MSKRSTIIFIMGHPATGKTTLSRKIADRLGLPLLSKDETFKERMFDEFETTSREWSAKIGRVSYKIMADLIEQQVRAGYSLIIESTFKHQFDNPTFMKLQEKYNFKAIQVVCHADAEILAKRFMARIESGDRHAGHGHEDEGLSLDEMIEAYRQREEVQPFDLQGEVIEVDANSFSETKTEGALQQVLDAYSA